MNARGFTLWELMVVVALVVIFFVAAIENLLPLRAEAERAAVGTTVGSLKSALGMETVRRAMARGNETLDMMAGANPMNWLAVAPANYSGTIDEFHDVPRGHWGFHAASGTLFYRVRYPEYFDGSFAEPPGLRFRVVAERGAQRNLSGVKLEQIDAGDWTTDGSEIGRLLGSR
ncbi:MAG TPA: type II secretion system protein [Gammaproteobacteria bacterium]